MSCVNSIHHIHSTANYISIILHCLKSAHGFNVRIYCLIPAPLAIVRGLLQNRNLALPNRTRKHTRHQSQHSKHNTAQGNICQYDWLTGWPTDSPRPTHPVGGAVSTNHVGVRDGRANFNTARCKLRAPTTDQLLPSRSPNSKSRILQMWDNHRLACLGWKRLYSSIQFDSPEQLPASGRLEQLPNCLINWRVSLDDSKRCFYWFNWISTVSHQLVEPASNQ